MLKILHISDVHFDAVYGKYSEIVRSELKSGVYIAFENAIDFAIENKIDLLVIAGDVNDRNTLSYKTENFVQKQLKRLADEQIHTVILHGNHDPSNGFEWDLSPEFVHVADAPEPRTFEFISKYQDKLLVSCNGFRSKVELDSNISAFPVRELNTFHIGVMHSMVRDHLLDANHDNYMMTSLSALYSKGYDYWALGHIHKSELLHGGRAGYSGSLQGLNAKEVGVKGGLLVEIDTPGSMPTINRVPFSEIVFEEIEVELDQSLVYLPQMTDLISKNIISKIGKYNELLKKIKFIVRVSLTGMTPLHGKLRNADTIESVTSDVQDICDILHLDIKTDDLVPFVDKDKYISASPFLNFIDSVIQDPDAREKFKSYAKDSIFAEMPQERLEQEEWLDALIENIEDEWLYKMVKSNED